MLSLRPSHGERPRSLSLKNGERSLTAIADPTNTVAEATEDNRLKVTVACKDD